MKIIAYIAAAILIFFGVLFMWGAFDPVNGSVIWLPIGFITVLIGLALIWFVQRKKPAALGDATNVTVKVDLPANVSMDSFKCKSCGGALTPENVKMVAGAPVVTCPYCGTSYQLTEEPKW